LQAGAVDHHHAPVLQRHPQPGGPGVDGDGGGVAGNLTNGSRLGEVDDPGDVVVADPRSDALHVADRVGDQRPPIPNRDAERDDVEAFVGDRIPPDDRALAEADDPVTVDEHGPERLVAEEKPQRRVRRHERALQRAERLGGLGPADGFYAEQHRQRQIGLGQGRPERGETAALGRDRSVAAASAASRALPRCWNASAPATSATTATTATATTVRRSRRRARASRRRAASAAARHASRNSCSTAFGSAG
jgi:hypothetical protein